MKKIRKVTFRNHPILNDLTLDFCDRNGKAVDTIILAGENGIGKSTILNGIYNSFNGRTDAFDTLLELETDNGIRFYEIKRNLSNTCHKVFFDEQKHAINSDFGSLIGIFSDVEINFHANQINSITSENIDLKEQSRRSGINLATQINQLIIDIQALDDAALARAHRDAIANRLDANKVHIAERMGRFKNAFKLMFENMSYDRVENKSGHKVIIFKKDGQDVPIEGLSSGEKQIVYRGCFLLKDINSLNDAFVFIDEPEISLHPVWQKKILEYYKNIFTNDTGKQTSQIFIVTHSPFIIHNANRKNDKVIVIARDENGDIILKDRPEYYKCDSIELVQDAFFIKDFSIGQPTVYLEGRTDEKYFRRAVEVFYRTDLPFEFKWVGYLDENEQERNTGKEALTKAYEFLISQNSGQKYVCLADCDTNRKDAEKNNVFQRTIQKYENTKKMKIGIENALILDNVDTAPFYIEKRKEGDYGDYKIFKEFKKMEFCDYICGLENRTLEEVFANLKIEIDKLIKLYQ